MGLKKRKENERKEGWKEERKKERKKRKERKISFTHCSSRKSRKENKQAWNWGPLSSSQTVSLCICVLVNGGGEAKGWGLMGFPGLPQLPGQLYKHARALLRYGGQQAEAIWPINPSQKLYLKGSQEFCVNVSSSQKLVVSRLCQVSVCLAVAALAGYIWSSTANYTCKRQYWILFPL